MLYNQLALHTLHVYMYVCIITIIIAQYLPGGALTVVFGEERYSVTIGEGDGEREVESDED